VVINFLISSFAFLFNLSELILGPFSPFPTLAVWVGSLVIFFIIGFRTGSFAKSLVTLTISFLIASVCFYLMIKALSSGEEIFSRLIELFSLKAIALSIFFVLSASYIASFFGYIFRR